MCLSSLWNQIYAYLRHRGASHHDAEDWTQNVYTELTLRGYLGEPSPEGGPSQESTISHAYLRTMARNEMADSFRRATAAKRRLPSVESQADAEPAADTDSPVEQLIKDEVLDAWELQLDRLGREIKQAQKKVLYHKIRPCFLTLDRSENLRELARESDMSVNNAKVQIHRWRKCLVKRIREEFQDDAAA